MFSDFGLDFGGSWASKSAALRAAPGVLDPIAFYACINILLFLTRGRPRPSKFQGQTWPCWAHVGTFFALGRLFFALGRFLSASCTFLTRVGRFFRAWGRCGLDFGWSGQVLEPSKPHFSMIFGVTTHASLKCSSCNKTTVFAMFYRLRSISHTATKRVFCIAFTAFSDTVQ